MSSDLETMAETYNYIDVAVTIPAQNTFTYKVPDSQIAYAEIGKRVLVPFGRRRITGYITGIKNEAGPLNSKFKIKNIIDILDEAPDRKSVV